MKLSRQAFIAIVSILLLLPLYLILRTVPVSRIWSAYSVLYVSNDVSEKTVLDILEENGVSNTISLSNQRTPFSSKVTPVERWGNDAYLTSRLSYFFDYSRSFRLYYIPEGQEGHTQKALKQLVKQNHANAGLDGRQRYPVLIPIITIAVYGVLVFFAKNHLVLALPGIFCLLLSFSQPFYPVASANCLLLPALFFAQRLWRRRKAIKVLSKNLYIILLLATAVLVCMLSSWKTLVLIFATLSCGVAALVLLYEAELYSERESSFSYITIFPATHVSVVYQKNVNLLLYISIPLALLTVLFLLSARFTPSSSTKLSLPAPVHGEGRLPVLEDYEEWVWDTETFPYRSLNRDDSGDEKTLTLTRYISTQNGIVCSEEKLMSFDEDYVKKVDDEIEKLPYPAIEKLMKRQGKHTTVSYSEHGGSKQQADSISLLLMLVSLALPLLLSSYYYVFGRGRYENRK